MTARRLLLLLVSIGTSFAAEPCRTIDGLEPLLEPGNILLLGELHGTIESPAFAADVACHAAGQGLPVLVGLEIPPGEQAGADAFLDSAGTKQDREAFLAGAWWQSSHQEGRSSRALFDLIDGLRQLDSAEHPVRLTFFDAPGGRGGQKRERGMAENLKTAVEASPGALTIVLTGNRHSRVTRGNPRNPEYEPMGYVLGQTTSFDRLIALDVAYGNGSAWFCTPQQCGIQLVGGRFGEASWKIEIDDATRPAGHQGWYHVGSITASPPATMDPDDPAAQIPVSPPAAEPERTPPAAKKSAATKPLPGKFQGEWQAWDFGSRHKMWAIDIDGNSFRAQGGEDDWYEGRIAVRPDAEPAEIDFAIEDCLCSYKGMTSEGIYFWDGESVVLSAPTPGRSRPQKFVESSGQMMRLLQQDED